MNTDAIDSAKELTDGPVLDVEQPTANEGSIDISSDDDRSHSDPYAENLNNLINALVDDGAPDESEKAAEVIQPVEVSQLDTGLKKNFLEDENTFENVLKWFTGDN